MNNEELNEEDLQALIELSRQGFKCDNIQCCEYERYNQCFNHSHVLCPQYEEFYNKKEKKH